ncbi:MAG: serine hydrolase [Patescibacteria group bacterium]
MKNFLLSFIFICSVLFPQFAKAEQSLVNFNLDETTLQRGYTLKSADGFLQIPIWPKFLNEEKKLSGQIIVSDLQINTWPSKLRPITPVYQFSFNESLPKAITFYFSFVSESDNYKEVYFFNENSGEWQELSAQIDCGKNKVKVNVKENRGFIAVFERTDELTAESAIVVDKNTGEVIFAKNVKEVRPMASLTKLMTAIVFLENNPGWNKKVVFKKEDFVGGATLYANVGDVVTVKDLFYAVLVGSKNNAVEALIRATGISRENFISKMNDKAKLLGLRNTYFIDPTGLSEKNVSTAEETAVLAKLAFDKLDVLKASTTKLYKVNPSNRKISLAVFNTSAKVLNRELCITGSKTGYTTEAGYNLVTQAKTDKHELIALVMGAEMSMNYEEVYRLLKKYL